MDSSRSVSAANTWYTNTNSIIAVFALADIVCALLPLGFIRALKRPTREKVVLGVLMGIGVFAALCSIMRAITYAKFLSSTDPAYHSADVVIWT